MKGKETEVNTVLAGPPIMVLKNGTPHDTDRESDYRTPYSRSANQHLTTLRYILRGNRRSRDQRVADTGQLVSPAIWNPSENIIVHLKAAGALVYSAEQFPLFIRKRFVSRPSLRGFWMFLGCVINRTLTNTCKMQRSKARCRRGTGRVAAGAKGPPHFGPRRS